MSKPIVIIIDNVKPQPKQRVSPNYKTRQSFTPKKTREFEGLVGRHARHAINKGNVITGPIKVTAKFVFEIPKSWSKKKKEEALSGDIMPIGKNIGDIDNLCKSVLDGIFEKEHGIAHLGMDDSQVAELNTKKKYGEKHQIIIILEEI